MENIKKPTYFELNGKVAYIIPTNDGGAKVKTPKGMSIADFMQDGTVIDEATYQRLARASAKDKAVS